MIPSLHRGPTGVSVRAHVGKGFNLGKGRARKRNPSRVKTFVLVARRSIKPATVPGVTVCGESGNPGVSVSETAIRGKDFDFDFVWMTRARRDMHVVIIRVTNFKGMVVKHIGADMAQCGPGGALGLNVHGVVPSGQDVAGGIV